MGDPMRSGFSVLSYRWFLLLCLVFTILGCRWESAVEETGVETYVSEQACCDNESHPSTLNRLQMLGAFEEAQIEDTSPNVVALSENGLVLVVVEPSVAITVYQRESPEQSWMQNSIILPEDEHWGMLGVSVDISADGSRIALGIPSNDSGDAHVVMGDVVMGEDVMGDTGHSFEASIGNEHDNSVDSGAVYVFHLQHDQWKQEAFIKPSQVNEGAQFGFKVALSENLLAVSAPEAHDYEEKGAVHVFEFVDQIWSQQSVIVGGENTFGKAIDLEGDCLVISSQEYGYVHVFLQREDGWYENQVIEYAGHRGFFGYSLALDQGWLAIGIPHDSLDGFNEGSVYLYEQQEDHVWQYHSRLSSPMVGDFGDGFGDSVSLSKGKLMVGETFMGLQVVENGSQNREPYVQYLPGQVYFYEYSEQVLSWENTLIVSALEESPSEQLNQFGFTVSLANNDLFAVGAESYFLVSSMEPLDD